MKLPASVNVSIGFARLLEPAISGPDQFETPAGVAHMAADIKAVPCERRRRRGAESAALSAARAPGAASVA